MFDWSRTLQSALVTRIYVEIGYGIALDLPGFFGPVALTGPLKGLASARTRPGWRYVLVGKARSVHEAEARRFTADSARLVP